MKQKTRSGYGGTGPGVITPDGCAVELYSRLPPGDEPDIVALRRWAQEWADDIAERLVEGEAPPQDE